MVDNCVDDWQIAMTWERVTQVLTEVVVCLIHCPPFLIPQQPKNTDVLNDIASEYLKLKTENHHKSVQNRSFESLIENLLDKIVFVQAGVVFVKFK